MKTKSLFLGIAVGLIVSLFSINVSAGSWWSSTGEEMGIEETYNQGLIKNVRFSAEEKAISLLNRVLIENDSPGAGSNRLGASREKITDEIWARKGFFIENPRAFQSWLVFYAEFMGEEDVPLIIEINSHSFACPGKKGIKKDWHTEKISSQDEKHNGWRYVAERASFYYFPFPTKWLQKGKNEVVLKTDAQKNIWRIKIADYRNFQVGTEEKIEKFPYTSYKSSDKGKTWAKKLGPKQEIEGEYTIRLYLKRYRPQGSITFPIIDLAESPGSPSLIKERVNVLETTLNWDKKTPSGTSIIFSIRSGKTPFYEKNTWGEWKRYNEGKKFSPTGRYLQWKAVLTTRNPLRTPLLRNVKIQAKLNTIKSAFADRVRVIDYHNKKIQRSAFPYEYESYENPKLKELRKKFELDNVVAGAETEFEKILKLMHWAYTIPLAERWSNPTDTYYSWNALDYCILERTKDGKIRMNMYKKRRRDRICTTSNFVLSQACLSFGITARHVGISGHEVCEAWSNDWRKWVFLDATRDFYYYDEVTGIPLSVLDIHNINAKKKDWRKLLVKNGTPLQKKLAMDSEKDPKKLFAVAINGCGNPYPLKKNIFMDHMDYFRIIPRNNFLSKTFPIPLNQGCGWMPWPWDGYLNWEDEDTPPLLHYSRHTDRPQDMYPTLNQVAYTLVYGKEEGTIDVYLDTFTSNFKTFLMSIDNKEWRETQANFTWKLHEGINTLQARSENSLGNRGIISKVELNFVH
jgi:hypothetical protein